MKKTPLYTIDGIETMGIALGFSIKEIQTTTVDDFKEKNMEQENKIVFGNWEPIKLKSWTYSTTEDFAENEDFVNEPIGDCDPNLIVEGEEMAITSDKIFIAAKRMARDISASTLFLNSNISADKVFREVERSVYASGFKKLFERLENEFGIKPDTFESLLDQHCEKSDIKVYFGLHEIYKVYKHECNLYFVLTDGGVFVYTLSALSKVITNADWLFSFSEPARLKAFLESLPLDQS